MAAACVRTLGKVGRLVLETPACRAANSYAAVPRITLRGSNRSYGTGAGGFRSNPFFTPQLRSVRVLGCSFLLGGGLGLYQTLKLTFQRHLAEEEAKVSFTFVHGHYKFNMGSIRNGVDLKTNLWNSMIAASVTFLS